MKKRTSRVSRRIVSLLMSLVLTLTLVTPAAFATEVVGGSGTAIIEGDTNPADPAPGEDSENNEDKNTEDGKDEQPSEPDDEDKEPSEDDEIIADEEDADDGDIYDVQEDTLLGISLYAADAWDGTVDTDWYTNAADGTGTANKPYEISTAAQLAGLAELVNDGTAEFSGKTIKLAEDIDLDKREWIPIGNENEHWNDYKFKGTFDGDGHIIRSLNVPDTALPGLFGQATGVIQNLIVLGEVHAGSTAEEYYYAAGGIVCYGDNVTVQNCGFYGTIYSGNNTYGAILGSGIGATVRNCWNYVVDEDIWSEYIFNNRTNLPSCIVISSDDSGESMDVSKLATLNTDIPNTGKMWAWSVGEKYPHLIAPPKTITFKPIFPDCTGMISVNGTELNADNDYTYEVTDNVTITVNISGIYYADSEGAAVTERTEIKEEGIQYTGSFPATLFYGTADDFDTILAWNKVVSSGYKITDEDGAQLKALARMVNSGKDSMEDKVTTLGANINLENAAWTSIGTETNPFKGTFKGGALTGRAGSETFTTYTISNLNGDLFGVVKNGTVQYVTIKGGEGRLVGTLESGSVQYCMSTAKVTGSASGLVGQNSGTVNRCYYYNADSKNTPAVAGSGTVTNCFYLAETSTFDKKGTADDTGARTEKEFTGRRVAYELGSEMSNKSAFWSADNEGMPCLKIDAKIHALTLTDLTGNGGVMIKDAFTDGNVQTFYGNNNHSVVLTESIAADQAVTYYPKKPTEVAIFNDNNFCYAVGKKIETDTSWYDESKEKFTLSDAADLFGFAKLVNEGNNFSGKTVELAADIDLTGYVWTPIGSGKHFAGTFNGNNHKVTGMSVFAAGIGYAGPFGYVSGGTVQNVHVVGKVTAMDVGCVGGIVGQVGANSVVQNCLSEVTVTATGKSTAVGGVVGTSVGTINLCWNKEAVTGGNANVGGIVGSGSAKNCANFGTVKGTSNAGGIAGTGSVENSYNLGDVTGDETFTEGISNGKVINSYYVCKLNGTDKMAYVNTNETLVTLDGDDGKTYMAGEKKLVDVLNDKHGTNELWFTNPEKNVYLPRHATKWDGETDTDCTFKTITVTYDPNGGVNKDGSNTPVTVSEMVYVVGEDVVTPAKHTVLAADAENLGFKHENGNIKETPWNTKADGSGTGYAAENTITIIELTKGITLYAQWDKIWEGMGTADEPYQIHNAEKLTALVTQVNNNGFDYNKKHFKLTSNITLTGEWTPIGNSITGASFNGNLNGNDKRISGLQITNGSDVAGLFGYLGTPSATSAIATIEKLTIEGSISCNGGQAGGLVGQIRPSSVFVLNNVHTKVSITGSGSDVGGIIGRVGGHAFFTNCSNGASVSGRGSVGGLVGSFVQGGVEFNSCSNSAAVTGTNAAGICAGQTDLTYTEFTGCVNNGAVNGTSQAAGISLGGTFTGCSNNQTVTSSNGNAAGIGINGKAEKCANHAAVSGGVNAAGILWSTSSVNSKIEFCYNTGAISGTYGSYGILAGASGTVKNCFTYNTDKHVALCPVSIRLNVTNSYYLANSATELNSAGEYATLDDFASGKVAWGVDGSTGAHANYWTQGANNYPVPIGEGTSTSYYRAKAECGTGGAVSIKSSRNFTGDADNAVYGPKGMSVTVTATPKDDTFGLKSLTLDLMGTGSTTALENGDSFTLGEANALVVAAFASTGSGGNGGGNGGSGGNGDGSGTDTGDGAGDEDDEGLQDGLNMDVEYNIKGLVLAAYAEWGANGGGKTFAQWLKASPSVLRAFITNSLDNMAAAAKSKDTDEAKGLAALLLASLNEHSGLNSKNGDIIGKALQRYMDTGSEATFSTWLTTGSGMASGTVEEILAQYTDSLLNLTERLYTNWESSGTSLTFPVWLDSQQVTMESLSENAEEPEAEPDDTQTSEAPEDVPDGQEAEGGASGGGNSVWEVIGTVVRENPIIVWSIVAVVAALVIVGAVRRYHKVKRDERDDVSSKK